MTIDGWAIRLISTFPQRSGHDPEIIDGAPPKYRDIRSAAARLLKSGHISDVVASSYSRLLVDEYQDCSIRQHAVIHYASDVLATCVVGDPLQSIFGFGDDPLADWDRHVVGRFPIVGELDKPWRWINAGAEELGEWLLDVRRRLVAEEPIDLGDAPATVSWVKLDGTREDYERRLTAGRASPPGGKGAVVIIGDSRSRESQRRFASRTPGAVTIEAVDLRDLVAFAKRFDTEGRNALREVAEFAQEIMTGVGAANLLTRVERLRRGTARRAASDVEVSAMAFLDDRQYFRVLDLVVEISRQGGVRSHRPAVLRALLRALRTCAADASVGFYEAVVREREQSRFQGRALPSRAVGSTLLLKGLEAEVAVILNAEGLNARNLYVAMTRGSKRLVVCARNAVLTPSR
jgi:DNA helicase-2/ATP-dependent DNA helicase PcrA